MSESIQRAIDDHHAHIAKIEDATTTPEQLDEIAADLVATYDLMNHSDAAWEAHLGLMRELDLLNLEATRKLRCRKERDK